MNAQGTVRLLFEKQEEQQEALAQLRTQEGQERVKEQFGEKARVEKGLSPHRMAFLRVPQRDGKESFKKHLERIGFTVEHIECRGQEGRRTHTRIVTVSEGERAREVIKSGELRGSVSSTRWERCTHAHHNSVFAVSNGAVSQLPVPTSRPAENAEGHTEAQPAASLPQNDAVSTAEGITARARLCAPSGLCRNSKNCS